MSELDAFLGPKDKYKEHAVALTKTNWGNTPARLRPTLDAFENFAGFQPGPWLRKAWRAGATDWVGEFGANGTELLIRTMEYMRSEQLVIKSPRSCISIAYDIRDKKRAIGGNNPKAQVYDRSKYLEGLDEG